MKKTLLFIISGVALLCMQSCFLFKSHENCPAYGQNEINTDQNATDIVVIDLEDKV